MNFKQDYKRWIQEQRDRWIGQKVIFEGAEYTVVDVDYNGKLLIDRPTEFTDTTAVPIWAVR